MANTHDGLNQPRREPPLPGSPDTHRGALGRGSRHAAKVDSGWEEVSSNSEPSVRSRTTARPQAGAATSYTNAQASSPQLVHHGPNGEDEEHHGSSEDGTREPHDEDDDNGNESDASVEQETNARERARPEHNAEVQHQNFPQLAPQPNTLNPQPTAPRSRAASSRPPHFHHGSPRRRGAAAEYYDPAQSFHTDATSSCCSSCAGTTTNRHAQNSTSKLPPQLPQHHDNNQPSHPSHPSPQPNPLPNSSPPHTLKPGILATLKALQHLHNNSPLYHADSWERVELLRRMDRTFNRGLSGKLTLLPKRKKGMFLLEAEATAARLIGRKPGMV